MNRLRGAESLQNVVDLRYGRRVNGNLLVQVPEGQATQLAAGEVMTVTATHEERAVLRQECFEILADLEGTDRARWSDQARSDRGRAGD